MADQIQADQEEASAPSPSFEEEVASAFADVDQNFGTITETLKSIKEWQSATSEREGVTAHTIENLSTSFREIGEIRETAREALGMAHGHAVGITDLEEKVGKLREELVDALKRVQEGMDGFIKLEEKVESLTAENRSLQEEISRHSRFQIHLDSESVRSIIQEELAKGQTPQNQGFLGQDIDIPPFLRRPAVSDNRPRARVSEGLFRPMDPVEEEESPRERRLREIRERRGG